MSDNSNCYVCGGDVDSYPVDHPELAICPNCCEYTTKADRETSHVFEYDRDMREHTCKYCGISAPPDFYAD